ncbi:hypothetical protein ASF06_03410 [Agreia sp. Leaf244]|uniref:DUF4342 domain-containing protein n=1 Tax=Agreia sp. Leaf244 TaxID=1736305 RepID=UPI0006F4BE24|nr:DUF4342 domain-containing protein [Agreia sp. Leaf244]KQO11692.1 hypothetical protein ASF06_03410 [Agreia sp. Leaf244]
MSDKKSTFEQFEVAGDKLVETVKNLIHEGNVQRIILKREDGSVLLEIPVNAGLVGLALTVAFAPVLVAIGAIAAVVSKITLVVERKADAATPVDGSATPPTTGPADGPVSDPADQNPAASI